MKAKVREQDKKLTLELLGDNLIHTNKEIEAATHNWFVDAVIKSLRKDGHSIKRSNYGRGVIGYKLRPKSNGE